MAYCSSLETKTTEESQSRSSRSRTTIRTLTKGSFSKCNIVYVPRSSWRIPKCGKYLNLILRPIHPRNVTTMHNMQILTYHLTFKSPSVECSPGKISPVLHQQLAKEGKHSTMDIPWRKSLILLGPRTRTRPTSLYSSECDFGSGIKNKLQLTRCTLCMDKEVLAVCRHVLWLHCMPP